MILLLAALLLQTTLGQIIDNLNNANAGLPIKFAYVNRVLDWSSAEGLAKSIGVPTFSQHSYNHICLTFWTCRNEALDAALLWDNPTHFFGTERFGSSNDAIRTTLKTFYQQGGVKLMVSAFGSTEMPTTEGLGAVQCADKLAAYVNRNQLDGVDIDWEDSAAFSNTQTFHGEQWLIDFTTHLKLKIKEGTLITHAPQAPYFGQANLYPKGGYRTVQKEVGAFIDFYNVQFYNQQSTPYDTSNGLFNQSGGWAVATSVNEIVAKGVPMNKIVIGKPATPADAYNTGIMSPLQLNQALVAAYRHNQWRTGLMFWQYSSDPNSSILEQSISGLLQEMDQPAPPPTLNFPIKFTCVNRINSQSNDEGLLTSLAVPVQSSPHGYNYVSFRSWTFRAGAQGALLFWVNPASFLTSSYKGARTNSQLRSLVKQRYSSQGIKIMVQAFQFSEYPTSARYKATEVAINLALFVRTYSFDGVDVNYQDNPAMVNGQAEQWISDFTRTLKTQLPSHHIVHTVNAGYFVGQPIFKNGGYMAINSEVGSLIDFYNVQYYRQATSTYNTALTLFNTSSGWAAKTSVNELVSRGIPAAKIVVGKTATISDGDASSFMSSTQLSAAIEQEYRSSGWKTGVMLYEFASDLKGDIIKAIVKPIDGI